MKRRSPDIDTTNGTGSSAGKPFDSEAAKRLLLGMEADLRTLKGVLAALRIMGLSADPIEPAAVFTISSLGEEALERITDSWRDALQASSG